MSREVMQQALDALEQSLWKTWRMDRAIDALQAALAQPDHEAVPLSTDELQEIFSGTPGFEQWALTGPQIAFARSIESAHGIK